MEIEERVAFEFLAKETGLTFERIKAVRDAVINEVEYMISTGCNIKTLIDRLRLVFDKEDERAVAYILLGSLLNHLGGQL